ncbi:MAG: tryptophan-rich sensory protein [Spirochaetes bacterium]|nr:tryptophan-rich sensory protein [Spirochaetota bacterium]
MNRKRVRDIVALIICLAIPFLAGAMGGFFTAPAIPTWYADLAKPAFNPPGWVFGPAWSALYAMMGVALYLVWRRGLKQPGVKRSAIFFAAQMALNAAWPFLFFGLRNPGIALVEIVILWVMILLTLLAFLRVSRTAGLLLVPYLAWVSFAAVLNFAIWRLN